MTCSVSSVVYGAKRAAENAESYAQDAMNRTANIESLLHTQLGRMEDILRNVHTMVERPHEEAEKLSEANTVEFLIAKLDTAMHRSLITPEQYAPLKAHLFGPDPVEELGEEVDASYKEVEE